MAFSRRSWARRTRRHARSAATRIAASQRFLRAPELLEERRLLSLATADYDHPTPAWFAAVELPYGPLTLAQAAVATASAPGAYADQLANPLCSRWIVRLANESLAGLETIADVAQRLNVGPAQFAVVRGLGLPGQVLACSIQTPADEAEAALRANPDVSSYEPDATITGQVLPNDPKFAAQIGLHNTGQDGGTTDADIDAPEAWNITTGSRSVVVAVLDTGVDYTHPDLAANIWTNPGEIAGNGIDDDLNSRVDDVHGYDFYNLDGNPRDDNRHGTHVAGTIAAAGNNAQGVVGTAWSASIMAVKFLDANNQGPTSAAIAAIQYVTTMRRDFGVNVRVINASWGGSSYSAPLRNAIVAAGQADILLVAAAGNGDVLGRGIDSDETPFYPASYDLDNIIVVAASDQNDKLARFSNYGAVSVDLAAPGVGIVSTEPGASYASRNGTSMAAPHVAGTAALIWSKVPYATAAEVRQAILQGVDVKAEFAGQLSSGGRLNVYGALTTDTVPPRATLVSAPNITSPGVAYQTILVTYADDTTVDVSTLDGGDLLITRPGHPGETYGASLVSFSPSGNGPTRTATYRMVAPGGSWGTLDNGEYRIELVTWQVADLRHNYARTTVLGSFRCEVTSDGVFEVNTTEDVWDDNPGNGSVNDGTGQASLRGAVQEANAMFGPATIIVPAGVYALDLIGADEDDAYFGDLDIYGQVTILGAGADRTVIDSLWLDRVFDILPGASLTLANLTIAGGNVSDAAGGGLRNQGMLTLDNVTVTDSSAGGVFRADGPESRVNKVTTDTQQYADVACDAAGNYVVVWETRGATQSTYWFQRYAADGTAQGAATPVGGAVTLPVGSTWQPISVAMDPNGYFVVAWTGAGTGLDIFAQRFKSDGTVDVAQFPVNTYKTANQVAPAVAVDATGAFVIAWQDEANRGGNATEIYAQRYRATGVKAASEIRLNTYMTGDQRHVDVAIDADGDFVATWESQNQDTSGWGIYACKGNVGNSILSSEIAVNATTAGDQRLPAVAMDAAGQFIVAWQSALQDGDDWGIVARRFAADGIALAGEFVVNTTTTGAQTDPTIAMDAEDGFVIAWTGAGQDGVGAGLFGQRYGALGTTRGDEFSVNLVSSGDQLHPRTAITLDDSFVVTWDGNGPGDASGVHARRFGVSYQPHTGGAIENTGTLTLTDTTLSSNRSGGDGGGLHNAGTATVNSSTLCGNVADGQTPLSLAPIRGEVLISSTVAASQNTPRVAFAPDGTSLVVWDTRADEWDGEVYGQRLDAQGALVNGELAISTDAGLDPQWEAAVAFDSQGNYVVTWTAWMPDGNHWGVLARMYAADATPRGAPFLVNSYTTDYQAYPQIAIDRSGNFVIVWCSLQGGSMGVYGQRYDALGQRQGGEFQVNMTTAGDQVIPEIVMDQDGNFIVAWFTWGLSGGICVRRYRSDGTPLTDEILVCSSPTVETLYSRIAADSSGNFVVAWNARTPDGTDSDIYARRYAFDGTPLSDEFRVNSTTLGRQEYASVSMTKTGELIVTWDSLNQDGDEGGVYGQLFDASGTPAGGEFRVNTTASGSQAEHRSAISADGRLLVVWQGNGPGDNQGIFGQLYQLTQSPTGNGGGIANEGSLNLTNVTLSGNEAAVQGGGLHNAINATTTVINNTITANAAIGQGALTQLEPAGSEFAVNQSTGTNQHYAETAMDAAGNYVVVWQSSHAGAISIFGRRFAADGTPRGDEFRISDASVDDRVSSCVAMNAAGDFVVVWEGWQGDADLWGLNAKCYNADGTLRVPSFVVNQDPSASQSVQPTVDMDGEGNFVVAWWVQQSGQIYARRFDRHGDALSQDILVNTATGFYHRFPNIAAAGDGSFVVVWDSDGQDGDRLGVYGQRYAADGSAVGDEFRVNTNVQGSQGLPSVSIALTGDFVVTWYEERLDGMGDDIYAQRFNAVGAREGNAFRVNSSFASVREISVVAFDGTGNFTVFWSSWDGQDGSGAGVYGQRFNRLGIAQGSEFLVNTSTAGDQWLCFQSAAINVAGDAVVVWNGSGPIDDVGVYGQRFSTVVHDGGGIYSSYGGTVTTQNTLIAGNTAVHESPDVAGVVVSQGGNLLSALGSATGFEVEQDAVPEKPEFLVTTPGVWQTLPTAASDAAGNRVVVWDYFANFPTGSHMIWAQRLNSDGLAQGEPFLVAELTGGDVIQPAVAMNAQGDFVVVWADWPGINYSVYRADGSRLAGPLTGLAAGTDEMPEFPQSPTVAMADSGEFVIAWVDTNSKDGESLGIFAATINAQGVPLTDSIPVNTFINSDQTAPSLSMDSEGAFVIVWASSGRDGDGDAIAGRRFNHDGSPTSDEFVVNALTTGNQQDPVVTMRRDGSFIVAWSEVVAADSELEIMARMFSAEGQPLALEFPVVPPGALTSKRNLLVAVDCSGNFVVAFCGYDDNWVGAYCRWFRRDGTPIGDAFLVNQTPWGVTAVGGLATTPGGDTLVVWEGNDFNGDLGLFGAIFATRDRVVCDAAERLGPLANNGGPTYTHALLMGSLAIEAGLRDGAPTTDQRGLARPQDADGDGLAVVDIGAYEVYYASLQGTWFRDTNGNAVRDTDETGVVGETVFLDTNGNGVLDSGEASTTTCTDDLATSGVDEAGLYGFTQLAPGTYNVVVMLPDGWEAVAPAGGGQTVSLYAGQAATGVDFATRPRPAQIRGQVFNDANRNHVKDPDEVGLTGWTVYLDTSADGILDDGELQQISDSEGRYVFTDIVPLQHYTIAEVPQENWEPTYPTAVVGSVWSVDPAAGEILTDRDFGNYDSTTGGQGTDGLLKGRVFRDDDEDRVQDSTEAGLIGYTLYLDLNDNSARDDGEPMAQTRADDLTTPTVDETGLYQFAGLPGGTYVVRLLASSGARQTAPVGNQLQPSAFATGEGPQSVVTGDFDRNGKPDLAIANGVTNNLSLLFNTGTGSFGGAVQVAVGYGPASVLARDVDGDGDVDLVAANLYGGTVSILKNRGTGSFEPPVNVAIWGAPRALAAGDFDHDGDLDLAVADEWNSAVSLLRNNGAGTFTFIGSAPVGLAPSALTTVQLNDDNGNGHIDDGDWPDLAVTNFDANTLSVLLGRADGAFAAAVDYTTGLGPFSVAAGDLDQDGYQDLVVANVLANTVMVLRNLSTGTFAAAATYAAGTGPSAVSVGDLDGDADLDVLVTNGASKDLSVLRNRGNGTFEPTEDFGVGDFPVSLPFSVAAGDLNADNVLDVAVANGQANNVSVLLNTLVAGAHRSHITGSQTAAGLNFGVSLNNAPPTLDAIADPAAVDEDAPPQTVALSGITAGGTESQALEVTAMSLNVDLVPDPMIVYTSPGTTGTLTWQPIADRAGQATIQVTVRDAGPDGLLGTGDDELFSRTFMVTVNPVAQVVGRHVFYNRSHFDGNNAAANANDDNAIAPDKSVLLPGQIAKFINYTSYDRGINGIMVDVDQLPGTITAADFAFKLGNSNFPDTWTPAPAPQSITVRGVNGADRVTLIWADGAIKKCWLQVTMLATDATGLATNDVFYVGNAVGESGNSVTDALVNATDEIGARNNPHSPFTPALVNDRFDYNRDKLVNATDQIIARNNRTSPFTALKLIAPPLEPVGGEGEGDVVALLNPSVQQPITTEPRPASSQRPESLLSSEAVDELAVHDLALTEILNEWDQL